MLEWLTHHLLPEHLEYPTLCMHGSTVCCDAMMAKDVKRILNI